MRVVAVLALALVLGRTAAAAPAWKPYADCAGVMAAWSLAEMGKEQNVPAYMRSKYVKRAEFFSTGARNLRRMAHTLPGYTEKSFLAAGEKRLLGIELGLKENVSRGARKMGEEMVPCAHMAGLRMRWLP